MLESYLLKGILVGIVFGVPAGAIGALTIQRALTHGFGAGFTTGIGSTAADVLYACVGVLGLTVISDFLIANQTCICMVGGLLIILLGISIFRKKGNRITDTEKRIRCPVYFGSSFAVAITNPATILAFLVAFSSFGIAAKPTFVQGSGLVLGILIGTCCWWGLLSGLVCLLRRRVTDRIYQRLNWILGSLMIIFGVSVGIRAMF